MDLTDFPQELRMERIVSHSGLLAACPGCGKQPKHILRLGKNLHFLECPPCGTRTAKFPTAQQAVEAWEAHETTYARAA